MLFEKIENRFLFPGSFKSTNRKKFSEPIDSSLFDIQLEGTTHIAVLKGKFLKKTSLTPQHIIFFYGNAGNIENLIFQFDFFRKVGFNTWMPDYVGYGFSSGSPSEKGCHQTALALYHHLTYIEKIPANKIIVVGYSLGSAVATRLSLHKNFKCMILFSPFTSIHQIINRVKIASYLSIHKHLKNNFNNIENAHHIKVPTLIAHGSLDKLVPCHMGKKIFNALKIDNKAFILVEGADHKSILLFDKSDVIRKIIEFIIHSNKDLNTSKNQSNQKIIFSQKSNAMARMPLWAVYDQFPAEYKGREGIIYHHGMRKLAWTCISFFPDAGGRRSVMFRHTDFGKVSAKFKELRKEYGT